VKKIFFCTTLLLLAVTYRIDANVENRSVPHHEETNFIVNRGNDICQQECTALKKRYPVAHEALEKFLNQTIAPQSVPTIGIACSGGGVRAAIALLGLLRGLEQIRLLDAITYCATLSGSTWSTAAWYLHNMTLHQLTNHLKEKLSHTFDSAFVDEESIMQSLFNKKKRGCHLSVTDIWGGLVADSFLSTFRNSGQYFVLSDLQQQTLSGTYPLPIFTAVLGETDPDYEWVEMTPFEVGSTYLGAWIDPHALGRNFSKGASTDPNPEETLGYVLGMASSAYAISGLDIIKYLSKKLDVECCAASSIGMCGICCSNERLFQPEINNFVYGLKGCPLASNKKLSFIDAGFSLFHPLPPLLRRHTAVYIICDVVAEKSCLGKDLLIAEKYARHHGYPFPPIDYATLGKHPLSIFVDSENKDCPVVIYVPNFAEFSTFKFAYSTEEFDRLMGGIEGAIIDNAKLIEDALKIKIASLVAK
jgi:hypothetical protein